MDFPWFHFACLLALSGQGAIADGPSRLPERGTLAPDYEARLLARHSELARPAPGLTDRERVECADWMRARNPAIETTLVGHHVVVMATKGFAARATENGFLVKVDLAYEVLRHLWGVDPCERVGRRFFVWPDPGRDGGHNCNGHDLRIAIGRADWDNADWFERFFHELTHGFQYGHPAGYLGNAGLFEGWAEFMQAAVCDHLAPLGPPFAGRFDWYAAHFPESARVEYLRARLPIEEIIPYDPSAGLFAELVATTRDARGHPDWRPLQELLQTPIGSPRCTPWHLWPARMAIDCMDAFGVKQARPILAKYRFPLDESSLALAREQCFERPQADPSPRSPVGGWKRLPPVAGPLEFERDPLGADDLAWRWRHVAADADAPPLPQETGLAWQPVSGNERGEIPLAPSAGGPEFHYLTCVLPVELRGPLTLYVSSDDDCAMWLDGELVHLFRGSRGLATDTPDVDYLDATGSRGQLLVLVENRGGPAGLSVAFAKGSLFERGFLERMQSRDDHERAAAVAFVAGRRLVQPARALLARAARDFDTSVREAACWWPDLRPKAGDWREAEEAYWRGSIRGGFFGLNAGTSGNQCVARNWGSDSANSLAVPLRVEDAGPQRLRVRYACPNLGTLRVRVRRGSDPLFTSELLKLSASGPDWNAWTWLDIEIPALPRGVVWVELVEPAAGIDVDLIGIVGR